MTRPDVRTADLRAARGGALSDLNETARAARNMYNGFHLGEPIGSKGEQTFAYWRGPMFTVPDGVSEQAAREAVAFVNEFHNALRRSFTSTNFIREVVRREVEGATAIMSWNIGDPDAPQDAGPELPPASPNTPNNPAPQTAPASPNTPQDAGPQAPATSAQDVQPPALEQLTTALQSPRSELAERADQLAQAWWKINRNHPERAIREAVTYARREGRGVLRFRVAAGLLEPADGDTGRRQIRRGSSAEDIARYIRLECLTPEQAAAWEDADSLERRGAYAYTDPAGLECAEVHFTNNDGGTVVRVLKPNQTAADSEPLAMNGRLLLLELEAAPLITPQVLQNQMAFNTASTMLLRNTELAGFVERYGINLDAPFVMESDPDRPGNQRRKYLRVSVGAGKLNLWRGATYDKTEGGKYVGEQPLGTPEYGRFEPSNPDALTAAAEHHRVNIYGEVAQGFVLMTGNAQPSGRSREVSLADYDNTRREVIDLARYTVGEVLETFLALVAALAGEPLVFDELRVEGVVRSRVVPPTAQDREQDRKDVEARIISEQTARHRQGIDEPDLEDAQIARESAARAARAPTPTAATVPPNSTPPGEGTGNAPDQGDQRGRPVGPRNTNNTDQPATA